MWCDYDVSRSTFNTRINCMCEANPEHFTHAHTLWYTHFVFHLNELKTAGCCCCRSAVRFAGLTVRRAMNRKSAAHNIRSWYLLLWFAVYIFPFPSISSSFAPPPAYDNKLKTMQMERGEGMAVRRCEIYSYELRHTINWREKAKLRREREDEQISARKRRARREREGERRKWLDLGFVNVHRCQMEFDILFVHEKLLCRFLANYSITGWRRQRRRRHRWIVIFYCSFRRQFACTTHLRSATLHKVYRFCRTKLSAQSNERRDFVNVKTKLIHFVNWLIATMTPPLPPLLSHRHRWRRQRWVANWQIEK